MTNEEAIKVFKGFRFLPREMQAVDMAKSALEKQIPKKPNKAIDKSWGIEKEAYVCPICDYFLPKIYFIPIGDREYSAGKKTTYCETCGQKIDWSEVEE